MRRFCAFRSCAALPLLTATGGRSMGGPTALLLAPPARVTSPPGRHARRVRLDGPAGRSPPSLTSARSPSTAPEAAVIPQRRCDVNRYADNARAADEAAPV